MVKLRKDVYKENNESYWYDTIFSNESKFNVFNYDGRDRVWRIANTELEKKKFLNYN